METQTCPVLVGDVECGQELKHVVNIRGKSALPLTKLFECMLGHIVLVLDEEEPRPDAAV
jgi:hypothetical protein